MPDLVHRGEDQIHRGAPEGVADLPDFRRIELDVPGDPCGIDVVREIALGERPPGPSIVRKEMSIESVRFGCDVCVNEMSATAAHASSAVCTAASTAAWVSEAGAFAM